MYGVTSAQAPLRLGMSRVEPVCGRCPQPDHNVDKKEPAHEVTYVVCNVWVCVCVRRMQKLDNDYKCDYKDKIGTGS